MPKVKKVEKLSVTIPKELASEVRAIVPQGKLSAFFAEAVQHHLAYRRQKTALENGFGAWKTENHPDLKTSQDSILYVRALREADKQRLTA